MRSQLPHRFAGPEIAPTPFDQKAMQDIARLTALNVQMVASQEELLREHNARLARLASTGVPPRRWKFLMDCDGGPCTHRKCSAACAFGERYAVNRLVLEAAELLPATGLPVFFAHLIDPHYFQAPRDLANVSLVGLFRSIRRRLLNGTEAWRDAVVLGGLHVSYDRELDDAERWTPHVHLVVAVNAAKAEVEAVLKPRRPPPAMSGTKVFRPIMVTLATDVANAISYATKNIVDTRGAILDGRGNLDRAPFSLPRSALREHDRWLLDSTPRERIFLSGVMMSRGGLVLRKR